MRLISSLSKHLLLPLGILLAVGSPLRAADNQIANGDFAKDKADWRIYVPEEESGKGATFSVTVPTDGDGKDTPAACLKADKMARFCISPKKMPPTEPGRYELSLRVRSGDDFEAKPSTPGFVIRLTQKFTNGDKPLNIYMNDKGEQAHKPSFATTSPPPRDWTTVRADFGIGDTTDSVRIDFFIWEGKGSLYLDDIEWVRLD